MQTLNEDPWGRPYKAVRGKLRLWTPKLTQSFETRLLEQVVSALFPNRAEHAPPAMVLSASDEIDAAEVPGVSCSEIRLTVLKLKSKSTAPGQMAYPAMPGF